MWVQRQGPVVIVQGFVVLIARTVDFATLQIVLRGGGRQRQSFVQIDKCGIALTDPAIGRGSQGIRIGPGGIDFDCCRKVPDRLPRLILLSGAPARGRYNPRAIAVSARQR